MTNKQKKGDLIISYAVMIQPTLLLIQIVLINVFGINEETTTRYREILTAIPMLLAMVVALRRGSTRFIMGYLVVLLLLIFTIVIHPQNEQYVISQGTRFLLPVVVPSFICLTLVSEYGIVEQALYNISWVSTSLVLIYIVSYFAGFFTIYGYNMPFSFACLLPMVSLYSHGKWYDVLATVIMFISILAIGARGPILCFLVFLLLAMFLKKSKWRFVTLILIVALLLSLSSIYLWLSSIGVESRTLGLLLYGDITSDSGRSFIQKMFIDELLDSPWVGIGLFGDRLHEGVAYCHNLFLEIFLDFGLFFGFFFILWGLLKVISIYYHSSVNNKYKILGYLCALVLPLMTSSSYLVNEGFAIFCGMCYLLNPNRKRVCL